jgi:hypothetical protein
MAFSPVWGTLREAVVLGRHPFVVKEASGMDLCICVGLIVSVHEKFDCIAVDDLGRHCWRVVKLLQ